MADNVQLNLGSGGDRAATDEVAYSGDTAQVQLVRVVGVSGAEGSKTVTLDAVTLLNSLDSKMPAAPATEGGNLLTLLNRTPALGQGAAAASRSVVLASDHPPVPTTASPSTATGSISTQNLVPNGAATANSAVEIVLNGAASLGIQTTGTYTGALSVQVTFDGSRWETITGAIIVNALTGVGAATIASAAVGVFVAPVHGALRARVTGLAAMTGSAVVTLRALAAPTALYAFQPTAANLAVTASGTVTANIGTGSLAAGTNAIGDFGVQYRTNATGAGTPTNVNCPATPAVQAIKATAGRLLGFCLSNSAASTRWLKVWNTASGGITLGTTAALFELALPPGQPVHVTFEGGIAFGTAISIAITAGQGLTNNAAVTLGDVTGFTVHA